MAKLSEQLPAATEAVHESNCPAAITGVTVTLPLGVPLPGATGVTLKLTTIGCPVTVEPAALAVMVVVVLALLTY